MDRNVVSGLLVVDFQSIVEPFDVIVHSCPGHTCDRNYADGVLVAHLYRLFNVKGRMPAGDRHSPHFDLPQLAEFLPYHLIAGAHHQIRLVIRLALCLPAFAPSEPGCDSSEHAGLR